MNHKILNFARLVEKDLGLNKTKIITRGLSLSFGLYSPNSDSIVLSNRHHVNMFIIVAHELRHRWQHKSGWVWDFSLPYKQQPHEIDAREYAFEFYRQYLKERNYV